MPASRFLDALASSAADGVRARGWSLQILEGRRATLGTKDRETGNPHAPATLAESLSARYRVVWEDGTVSRGALERRQLDGDPRAAVEQARAAAYDDPDATTILGPASFPDVRLHDDAVAAAAGGDLGAWIPRLAEVRGRVESRGVRTWSGSWFAAEGRTRVITSSGLDVSARSTAAGWHVTFDGELGCGFAARAFESSDRFLARLDRCLDDAARLSRSAPDVEGSLPVLLHPDVVGEYVLPTLLHNLDGSTVSHGEGWFPRDRFGSHEPAIRADLTLRVDPLLPLAAGAYRFTSEGLPAARCDYVRDGRLVTPVLDLKYARRLGLAPTPLPGGDDTLFLEERSPLTLDEALAEAEGGALVFHVLGVHTLDPGSGEFSLSAPQTLAISGRGLGGRIRATISGNLLELLRRDDTRLVRFEDEHLPGMLVRCRLDGRGRTA